MENKFVTFILITIGFIIGFNVLGEGEGTFPWFIYIVTIVVAMGWGNKHLFGQKRDKPSFIERWYGVGNEDNKN